MPAINLGQVDFAETAKTVEFAKISTFPPKPNQIFNSHYGPYPWLSHYLDFFSNK